MVAKWATSGTFAHGFLIVPLSVVLVWLRRHELAGLAPASNLWGLGLLAILTFGWLMGDLADVVVIQQFALVSVVQVVVWTLLGSVVTRAILFPLLFLWFAVPVGDALVPPLQDFTAAFAVTALQLSGVPVFADGWFIATPTGNWRVAEACAGVRYVIPALALGWVFAWLTYRSWWRRLSFLAAAVVVSIVANGVRAYGIIMLGYLSNNHLAAGVDHLIYGGIFFAVVIVLLFTLGLRWQEPAAPVRRPSTFVPEATEAPSSGCRPVTTRALVLVAVASVIVVALGPVASHTFAPPPRSGAPLQLLAPQVTSPWTLQPVGHGTWTPHFLGADAEVHASYQAGARPVELYMAYYVQQRQGAEVINADNLLADAQQWVPFTDGYTIAAIDGQPLRVRVATFGTRHGRAHLVTIWYWVDGRFTANPYYAKWLQVHARLLGRSPAAAVIALSTEYESEPREAVARVQDFLVHTVSLQATLRRW
jgi:exosortase A